MSGVRVGLVGLGRVAEVGYLPAIQSLDVLDLVGVADVRHGRAELLAPGVPSYTSTDELLTAGLELLVIATPVSRHLGDATSAASAGVQALIEKPAVETLADARALAALVPAPWLGQDRRFDERTAHLRSVVATFAAPLDVRLAMSVLPASWGASTPGPGPLLDLGPHVVDLARWLSRDEAVAVHGARSAGGSVRFDLELRESNGASSRFARPAVARAGRGARSLREPRTPRSGRAVGPRRREAPSIRPEPARRHPVGPASRGVRHRTYRLRGRRLGDSRRRCGATRGARGGNRIRCRRRPACPGRSKGGGVVLALISFDGTSSRLVDELLEDGRLPNLASLRASSASYRLLPEAAPFEAAVFPTLCSGTSLSEHGLHYPFMWDASEQRARYIDHWADERRLLRLARVLEAASDRLASAAVEGVVEMRPDVVVAGLVAVHLGGHQLWDPASVVPGISREAASRLQGSLRTIYERADAALGRILGALPPEADVVVFSGLGMGPEHSRTDMLPALLDTVLSGARAPRADSSWRIRASVPASLRARIANALPDGVAASLAARLELRGVDWGATRAFVVPSDVSGFIRFNVRGRERDGVVDPGDVSGLVDEILAGLESFVLPSGAPVVESVSRSSELVAAGAGFELLPDLVVRWAPEPTVRDELVTSPRHGSVRRQGPGSGRSGNPVGPGWVIVRPGAATPSGRSSDVNLLDIPATALSRFGLDHVGTPLLVGL